MRPPLKSSRRIFLRDSGIGLAGLAALDLTDQLKTVSWRGLSASATVTIDLEDKIGRIDPNIYGHMAEHIGHLVYDGLWVGEDSRIPNREGIRQAAIEALRRVGVPVIRWPGGCFADAYHWKDGIGSREERPERRNFWWNQAESNHFGTHEFLRLCELTGAEPYLSVNLGSGTLAEAMEWVEYCNSNKDTQVTRLRAQNGHAEPYRVRYWGVGNESWGCGGLLSARDYAREYLRYALYLKRGALPALGPSAIPLELVAVGHAKGDWNQQFLEEVRAYPPLLDHLSIHHYFRKQGQPMDMPPEEIPKTGDISFDESEYYWLINGLADLEKYVQDAIGLLACYFGGRKKVGLMVDEWGAWHPQAMISTGFFQQNTVRDAVLAGSVLNFFNRQCRDITMANIAQSFNVMQAIGLTRGEKLVLTPTFYVMEMYRTHHGAELVRSSVEAPSQGLGPAEPKMPRSALSVSSSLRQGSLFLSVVNEHLTRDLECKVLLAGGRASSIEGLSLTSADATAHNTFEDPQQVRPRPASAAIDSGHVRLELPAHSVNTFKIALV